MNIIKLGGSVINPDGTYDDEAIGAFIRLARGNKRFIFVVGGGTLCRLLQQASMTYLKKALPASEISLAADEIGIAVTKINARYVLGRFQKAYGARVYPEILLDPAQRPKSAARIFIASGWKPGCSTDLDMVLLARTFSAQTVIKLTNIAMIKDISPLELAGLSPEQQHKALAMAKGLPNMTWKQLRELMGDQWTAGLHAPFDPQAAALGCQLRKKTTLYLGKQEELPRMLAGKAFKGTVVKG